jgi:hypothetical protein
MANNPISLSRRHVLGDLYARCDSLSESIPVYSDGEGDPVLGSVDESLGHYRDAFSFHLSDDVCKQLAAGHYSYSFDYTHSDPERTGPQSRITLNSIKLIGRRNYQKPAARGTLVTTT